MTQLLTGSGGRVRTPAPSGLPPLLDGGLHTAFALGELLSPTTAARLAEDLFLRPPPAPPTHKRQRDFVTGEPVTVWLDGRRIAAERWLPAIPNGRRVLLVHGWGGWRQQLAAHVPGLVADGFEVVSFDALAHGDSDGGALPGRRTTMVESAQSLTAVVEQTGVPDAVVVHSGGAMATALAMRRAPFVTRALVLIAPSVQIDALVTTFSDRLGIGPQTTAAMLARTEKRFRIRMADLDVLAAADELRGRGPLPPLLVIHDRADPDTPHRGSELLAEQWPGARLTLTDGLGHRRLIWDAGTVAATRGFLLEHLLVG